MLLGQIQRSEGTKGVIACQVPWRLVSVYPTEKDLRQGSWAFLILHCMSHLAKQPVRAKQADPVA